MDIKIRIYTQTNKYINVYSDSRSILLNEGELDDMIKDYLAKEQYLKDGEEITSIIYEEVKL